MDKLVLSQSLHHVHALVADSCQGPGQVHTLHKHTDNSSTHAQSAAHTHMHAHTHAHTHTQIAVETRSCRQSINRA